MISRIAAGPACHTPRLKQRRESLAQLKFYPPLFQVSKEKELLLFFLRRGSRLAHLDFLRNTVAVFLDGTRRGLRRGRDDRGWRRDRSARDGRGGSGGGSAGAGVGAGVRGGVDGCVDVASVARLLSLPVPSPPDSEFGSRDVFVEAERSPTGIDPDDHVTGHRRHRGASVCVLG
jgi:hypothetical protein